MTSTELAAHIQSLPDAEILAILDQPENYLPLAIEIAKKEVLKRQLTEEAINELRNRRLQIEKDCEIDKEYCWSSISLLEAH